MSADPGGRSLDPDAGCALCPRLVAFRTSSQEKHSDWHNAPVPAFGDLAARILVVGLAPGLKGANRTGRPFTGDYAGDLLYPTLIKFDFAAGRYEARPDDGLVLRDCRITNAARCVPPENKPTPAELAACRPFLAAEIKAMPRLRILLALGGVAHKSVLAALGLRQSARPFVHGAVHEIGEPGLLLADSYHCSRYNTNTGRLTVDMFESVFATIRARLDTDA